MQTVLVTSKSPAKDGEAAVTVFRASIDGVRLWFDNEGKEKRQLSSGWHNLSWHAAGNQGATYTIKLAVDDGREPCAATPAIPATGIDSRQCDFEVY